MLLNSASWRPDSRLIEDLKKCSFPQERCNPCIGRSGQRLMPAVMSTSVANSSYPLLSPLDAGIAPASHRRVDIWGWRV